MGRKKRDQNTCTYFCYYCDKEFDKLETLIQHQRNTHFNCPRCKKKFATAASLAIHMLSVHRETLAKVPNAKVGRDSIDINIYGMEGVPAAVIQEKMISKHKKKLSKLQYKIQKECNLKENLDPTYVSELKESNAYFETFKNYTARIEADAGLRQYTAEPSLYPDPNANLGSIEKRESKFLSKQEEHKADLMPPPPMEELKQPFPEPAKEEFQAPKLNLNLNKSKTEKKKVKQEIQTFVSKLSPEEKRAQMEKYKYDESKITKELGSLRSSIKERLAEMKSRLGT